MARNPNILTSASGRRWLEVMGRMFPAEGIAVVQHYAIGLVMQRHGRYVTSDDLSRAAEILADEKTKWPQDS